MCFSSGCEFDVAECGNELREERSKAGICSIVVKLYGSSPIAIVCLPYSCIFVFKVECSLKFLVPSDTSHMAMQIVFAVY